jgi:hypothetical protein
MRLWVAEYATTQPSITALAMARKFGAAGAAADSNSKAAIENAMEILLMAISTAW